MHHRYRLLLPLSLLLLVLCNGCADLITIQSPNEPATDADALQLVGFASTTPGTTVAFRAFQGGLDDNLRMVLHIPHHEVMAFWDTSPWHNQPCTESHPSTILAPDDSPNAWNLPAGSEPIWHAWTTMSQGCIATAHLPNAEVAAIVLTSTQHAQHATAYIFWYET